MATQTRADVVIREFPPLGKLRVRLLESTRGRVLDIREYVSADGFEGFTRKGVRLDARDLANLAETLAELATAPTEPGITTRPRRATPAAVRESSARERGPVKLSAVIPPALAEIREKVRRGEVVALTGPGSVAEALAAPKAPAAPVTLDDITDATQAAPAPEFLDGADLDHAWTALRALGIDPGHTCGTCGEGWQYMGPEPRSGRQSFRHRCGSGHGARRYETVDATPAPVAPAAADKARRDAAREKDHANQRAAAGMLFAAANGAKPAPKPSGRLSLSELAALL